MPRFVLLRHDLPDGAHHYDLMLEHGGALATWRLPAALSGLPPAGAEAVALGDHRLHYLTHEGDIGGGRGTVRRVDGGTYEAEVWHAGGVAGVLATRAGRGRLELTAGAGAAWRVRFALIR